jgi:hypothetical protein
MSSDVYEPRLSSQLQAAVAAAPLLEGTVPLINVDETSSVSNKDFLTQR